MSKKSNKTKMYNSVRVKKRQNVMDKSTVHSSPDTSF